MDVMKLGDKDRAVYKRREENRLYKESLLYTAERKGLEKGLEEGKKEGLEEGLKEGLEEGEKRAKIEIAKSLLDVLDIETISLKTGLTIEEIILLK